jgi:RHS repeat-associated protein
VTTYDNLNEVTETQLYTADGATPTISGGVLNLPAGISADLRAQTTTSYDELSQVFRTDTFDVNPTTGAVGANTLSTQMWYDPRGNVIATLSPGGLVTKDSYDGAGRVVVESTTDGAGGTSYAAAGTVASDTVLDQIAFTYDNEGNVLETVARQRFDSATGTGALGTPTSGIGARVSYTGAYYDLAGRLIASVDVGTNGGTAWTMPTSVPSSSNTVLVTSTSYSTDAVQDVTLMGGPTGGTFTLSFGGQTTSAIAYNASAATVQSALAALSSIGSGNVAVITPPGGSGWEVRFTGTLANSYQVALTGNGGGLTGGTAPSVSVSTVSYGGDAGDAAQVTDPAGHVMRTYTDAEGRPVRTVENFTDGVVTSSSNKTTGYTYNSAGTTSLTAYLTGGGGQTTAYVYGVSQTTGSAIDSNDIVGKTQYPDPTTGAPSSSQQEATTVNALGQTLTYTDRNGTVHTYTYDVLGRVVSDAVTTLGSGVDGGVRRIQTAYDGLGNPYLVTSYDSASGGNIVNQVERVYNGLDQLTAEYQAQSGAVNTSTTPAVRYGYSEMAGGANNSRLTSMTYPDGYVVTYNYSSGLNSTISRLSSLSDSSGTLESYKYLGLDTVVERDHPQTNVNLTYISLTGTTGDAGDQYVGLDRFGRVVAQLWYNTSTGSATDEFLYGYDQVGNRTAVTNGLNGAFSQGYNYDGLYQLTGFTQGSSTAQSFSYDAAGNATSVTTNGTTQTRSANALNQYTGISGATTPTYDANGNMTTDETGRQFVYDAWNRLVAVKNSSSTTLETFTYDGLDRRVTQAAGGTTTDLFYSAQGQVLEEEVSGQATARYVWSPVYVDALVLRDNATGAPGTLNQRLWVQQDANWNVTALVNGSGAVVERYVYSPYGVAAVYTAWYSALGGSAYGWVYGYQGMRYDATSGLNESLSRWYSPTLQRWTSTDPSGYGAGDVNLYGFVGNNPAAYTDPTGLDRIDQVQAGNQTLLWYVVTGPFGDRRRIFIGLLIPNGGDPLVRRFVDGQPLFVPLSKVNQTAGFWESTPSNWNQWFKDNAAGVNDPSIKNLAMQMGSHQFTGWNDLANGQQQITGLAKTAIYWNAGAGFNASPSQFSAAARCARPVRPPLQCFPAGTPVHTPDGLKPVEQVAAGDRVWAYDHRELQWTSREVLEVYAREHRGTMTTLRVQGETLRATGGHPFWVVRGDELRDRPLPKVIPAYEAGGRQEGRWVLAAHLRAGDEVLLRDGRVVVAEAAHLEDTTEQVYNFRVAELENYSVGVCGVLVHNTNAGMGNIGSHAPMPFSQATNAGFRWLGPGAREIAPGTGIWRSADGLRQFRMTNADILGLHGTIGPHVHFESLNSAGAVIENLHIPVVFP